ncbi:MAG: hypothetical protein CM15mP42_06440 [Methanobacteriota archaeon]|nr:MAG: hypothetical protein CM15mP42_06440 [Euryarchaeota archaeon]
MKKVSLMIFVALLLVSGSGAYAYTEGVFDDILEFNEDEDEIVDSVPDEKPAVIEEDLAALSQSAQMLEPILFNGRS